MSIVTKTISFTIDIDTEEIKPAGVYTWLFQLLNRLDYEHDIKSITIDGKTVDTTKTPVEELELAENRPLLTEKERETEKKEKQAREVAREEAEEEKNQIK